MARGQLIPINKWKRIMQQNFNICQFRQIVSIALASTVGCLSLATGSNSHHLATCKRTWSCTTAGGILGKVLWIERQEDWDAGDWMRVASLETESLGLKRRPLGKQRTRLDRLTFEENMFIGLLNELTYSPTFKALRTWKVIVPFDVYSVQIRIQIWTNTL